MVLRIRRAEEKAQNDQRGGGKGDRPHEDEEDFEADRDAFVPY